MEQRLDAILSLKVTSSLLGAARTPLYCTHLQDRLGGASVASIRPEWLQTWLSTFRRSSRRSVAARQGHDRQHSSETRCRPAAGTQDPRFKRNSSLWCKEGHLRLDCPWIHKTLICWRFVRIGAFPPQRILHGAYFQCQHHAKPQRPAQGRLALHEESGLAEQTGHRRPAGKPFSQRPGAVKPFTDQTVELALKTQAPRAIRYVKWLQKEDPHLSQTDLVKTLENKFRREALRIGRASGAAQASRDSARVAATDRSAGKATLEAAVFFILAVTEAHDIPLAELEFREKLVRSVLLAKGTDNAVRMLTSQVAPRLASQITAKIPASTFKPINNLVGYRLITKRGQTGTFVIEDLAASGVGSLIGIGTNTAFAWHVIRASRSSFKKPDLEGVILDEGEDAPGPEDNIDIVDDGAPGPARA